ncbi:hypothetical protein L249_1256 [Ophiocordyceps polyrhachis-furcata BCC 54312]|uniref:Uncharacterized protein n=1 Tax=Ophiocordyceps polyrhachis-furcata BCC 54312 TaxID=1330021 RepID=A0A367LE67_9HYPO|nr:hypothetical protein L249_1256 [Ophiocordyceps polyrhachis-furcata BCC 54312]
MTVSTTPAAAQRPSGQQAQGAEDEAGPGRHSPQASSPVNTPTTQGQGQGQGQTSTPPQAQAASISPPPPSVPAGTVAGIAIGCVVGGILVGLLAAFLLLRRRSKKKAGLKPTTSKTSPTAPAPTTNAQLDHFLLEATPDEDIAMEMEALRTLIRQHVDDHYHRGPVDEDAGSLSQPLVNLGVNQRVAALCVDYKTRQQALQHVLSRVIFNSIDFRSRAELSLMPTSVAAFIEEMPSNKNDFMGDSRVRCQALSQWRRLSAFLLHPNRGQRTPLPSDNARVSSKAQQLTTALNGVLRPFTEPDAASQQTRHLELVILECAKLGYVLFSHPSDWRFVTEHAGTKEDHAGIVVEAGLVKLSDREGVPYRSPRSVVDPVVYDC